MATEITCLHVQYRIVLQGEVLARHKIYSGLKDDVIFYKKSHFAVFRVYNLSTIVPMIGDHLQI